MNRFLAMFVVVISAALYFPLSASGASIPVVTTNFTTFRAMAANLTGGSQKYDDTAIRIFQALDPDVVAIQEFNFSNNTPAQIRSFVDTAFGTNFVYFRETNAGYSIPNGIISRWPFITNGTWDDTLIPDRGYAWARIDLPGTNDLYVVSVHLKAGGAGSDASTRSNQALNLKALIQANFPANALLVVAGDCNIGDTNESALATMKTYLSDTPVPTDAVSGGDPDTNNGRSERYDYVFPSPRLASNHVALVTPSNAFPNGLVFDSRVNIPLTGVSGVLTTDSSGHQHMAVLRDFQLAQLVTNFIVLDPPDVNIITQRVLRWAGLTGLTYTVQRTHDLTNWSNLATVYSPTTNFGYTNATTASNRFFYRVTFP